MSIATEITRLQGVKTDIRNALISQGVDASTHNMANFSADILSIEGGGEKGVFVEVTCDEEYIGSSIYLYLGTTLLDTKTCPSSKVVNLYASADNVPLGSTLTIKNNHSSYSSVTVSVSNVNVYGWYNATLNLEPIALVPLLTSSADNVTAYGSVICAFNQTEGWKAFDGNDNTVAEKSSSAIHLGDSVGYSFANPVKVLKIIDFLESGATVTKKIQYSDDGSTWNDVADSSYQCSRSIGAVTKNISDIGYHKAWRIYETSATGNHWGVSNTLQFYGYKQ